MNKNKNSNPSFIARETLKQLALLKIPPTPDNYYKLYGEIEGNPNSMPMITEKLLIELAKELPRHTPQLLNLANNLEQAAKEKNWAKYKSILAKFVTNEISVIDNSTKLAPAKQVIGISLGETLRKLLKQLEVTNESTSIRTKRNEINQVINEFNHDTEQLHDKLRELMDLWCSLKPSSQEIDNNTANISLLKNQTELTVQNHHSGLDISEQDHISDFINQTLELIAQILEHISNTLTDDKTLADEAKIFSQQVRIIRNKFEMEQFISNFQAFYFKLESRSKNGIELQQGLVKLLNLLMDSTGELLSEDQWIKEQIFKLRETISKPLDMQVLTKAEHYLQEIIRKQEIIRNYLGNARLTVKQMVNSLINNIEELSDSTGSYHERLEYFSEEVNKTNDLEELNRLLVDIMQETQTIQNSVSNYREDLLVAREEVNKAHNQINQLENELIEMGEKIQEDHLTGIYNRRGLDNVFKREISRAQRSQEPFCFVLLDIDNFKQLNDTYGHQVGDDALVFLVDAIKESTRSEDIVSRYGGEEFALLLPNTMLDEAILISSRILRNLTKKFFLHRNNRLLITFSAGVAQYQLEESQESIIKRADEAMYRAKKSGKNQILASE
jgi:diguanylate cyclase